MYINRMRLRKVKSLNQDIPESGGALPELRQRRLLLLGANGSGKTTVLETIWTLWRFWGEWMEEGPDVAPPEEHLRHYLAEADLAAMEIIGIPNASPLWIGMGKRSAWRTLQQEHPEASFAGLTQERDVQDTVRWQIELPATDLLGLRHRSLVGSVPFPNVVYFPPEYRTIQPPDKLRGEIIDTTPFHWAAVYDPTLSLDSILLTVKALSAERFSECLHLVNLALQHQRKRIAGFGLKGRLVVEGTTKAGVFFHHAIEDLSSGERQMLLLVAFVVAFLQPGGIVLLDEPDLHLHIGMVEQLLETVELVVRARHGQWIVASQAERVWGWFPVEEEQINLSPWRGGRA